MKWYLENGPMGDVVISTRIRLARNISDFPFPCKLNPAQKKQINEKIKDSAAGNEATRSFEYTDMQKLTPAHAMSLSEKHLVSPEFAQNRDGRALLLSPDETVSIMLNEEDHLRIQVLLPGMQLEEALNRADTIDDVFESSLHYAFDENLGYLTQCPTNLGTGLRASLMLHLPAITQTGAMPSLVATMAKLGLTIRGTYGEGTQARGAFYQVSNQVTLGISEKQAVANLGGIAQKIIAQELAAREALKNTGVMFEDRIYRSLGILRSARMLSTDEFMSLISNVRLGVSLKLLDGISLPVINEIMYAAQPAMLTATAGRSLPPQGRDELRAKIVREKLGG